MTIIVYTILLFKKDPLLHLKRSQQKVIYELPLSREYKKELESKKCRPRIKIPENIRDKKIIQVEIIPINNGRMFQANFTYEVEKEPLYLDKSKVIVYRSWC